MRNIKVTNLIGKSIRRTVFILFKPFSLKKWLCLLLIAYMAGAIGGGNSGGGGNTPGQQNQKTAIQQNISGKPTQSAVGVDSTGKVHTIRQPDKIDKSDQTSIPTDVPKKKTFPKFLPVVIIPLVLVVIALLVLFMWLGARFKFIWFRSMIENDVSIKMPFSEFQKEGDSLFRFFLIFTCAVLVFVGLLGLWAFIALASSGAFQQGFAWSFSKVLAMLGLPLLILILGIVVSGIFYLFIDHFVVTIMGLERCPFSYAWGKFKEIFRQNRKDFILYVLVLLGLGIIAGAAISALAIVCLLVILLAGALILGLPYLLIGVLLKIPALYIIFAVIVGAPFIVAAFILLLSVGLPFAVFFRSFSLYFLSSLECGYVPLPLENISQEP